MHKLAHSAHTHEHARTQHTRMHTRAHSAHTHAHARALSTHAWTCTHSAHMHAHARAFAQAPLNALFVHAIILTVTLGTWHKRNKMDSSSVHLSCYPRHVTVVIKCTCSSKFETNWLSPVKFRTEIILLNSCCYFPLNEQCQLGKLLSSN
jgi:hypothetical protein